LPDIGLTGRDGKPYLADPGLRAAAGVGVALALPLLLTGAPGCGKTDFAWVMAPRSYLRSASVAP
jgi:MoxR-like ATPase